MSWFPVTRTIIEEVETSTGVDVANEEELFFRGHEVVELVVVEDFAKFTSELSGLLVTEDDDYDYSDSLDVDVEADADELVSLKEKSNSDLDVSESLVWVTEPPSLDPVVSDFYRQVPRLADVFADFGEVVAWSPEGVGRIETTTQNAADSGRRLVQIRANEANSTFVTTPTSNFQNDFRANTNTLGGDNERMLVAAIRLEDMTGIQWTNSISGTPTTWTQSIRNTSGLTARNATFWAGFLTSAEQSYTNAPTWNNVAAVRQDSEDEALASEQWHNQDVSAGATESRGVIGDQFTASGGSNLWVVLRQFETVLAAGEMRCDTDIIIELEFAITG